MEAVAIYGPPGTGKTETLVRASRDLLQKGHKVCFVSHTKAAAEECSKRMGDAKAGRTLHSLAYGVIGLRRAAVVTSRRLLTLGEYVSIPCGSDNEDAEGDLYLSALHLARSTLRGTGEVYDWMGRPGTFENFKAFVVSYLSWKEAFGLVDFTDMIERATRANHHYDFDTLIVDESQDLSPLQWKFVEQIAAQMKVVMIAGDDDQTIYEWSGADPHGMASFEHKTNARRVVLDRSYRVPQSQFDLAQKVIHQVARRVEKAYSPTDKRGQVNRYAGIEQLVLRGGEYVLCRDKFKVAEAENAAIQQGLRYRIEGAVGMPNKPYSIALGIWKKLFVEENSISESELHSLHHGLDERGKVLLERKDFTALKRRGWAASIPMPIRAIEYYMSLPTGDNRKPVVFSTIHGAKGKEADHVVLYTSLSQKTVRSFDLHPDPEHRLFYVGITRSKSKLDIIDGPDSYVI